MLMIAREPVRLVPALERAKARRAVWEPLWRDCYAFAQPQRGTGIAADLAPGARHADRLFDGTAVDGVEQLAASLMAELLPAWSSWFGLKAGADVPAAEVGRINEELEVIARRIQGHFDRSNLLVELHQAILDLVTIGTATILFEEAPIGDASAFRFAAVPGVEMYVDGDSAGAISGHYRVTVHSAASLALRFPAMAPAILALSDGSDASVCSLELVEAIHAHGPGGAHYQAFLPQADGGLPLAEGRFESSPFITFRWGKGAGEIYGRSPVMSALPDIKTANKVVELVLKNASIAATGIWLADDDGVLNPANIRLVPGSIIPKAVGSAGLTPLQAPGRFDVSQLVLDDLRNRIRQTLLIDRLGPPVGGRMTATEVLERSAEQARLLGAVFGRIQAELLLPLINRALAILRRRGEIPDLALDGRLVELDYRTPMARARARQDVTNTLLWLETVGRMGEEAKAVVDTRAAAIWIARSLGVSGELVRENLDGGLEQLIQEIVG